jgi:hypothetical protein
MFETAILVFVGVVLFLVFLWLFLLLKAARDVRLGRNIEKARKRMKDPIDGTLAVTAISAPSNEAVWSMAEITGIVSGPGLEPRAVQRHGLVRTALWPTPGQALPILVDRANPDVYFVIWARVKAGSEAALEEAQRLAAAMRSEGR